MEHMNNIMHDVQTIVMKVPAKNVDLDGMISSLISECIWGIVETPSGVQASPSDWTIISNQVDTKPPQEHAVTFGWYVENIVCLDFLLFCNS